MSTTVEICVAGIDGALAACRAGADRIELNSGLQLGGVTPSIGLIRTVTSEVGVPVIVMLRPRESGFCYGDSEYDVMRRDLDAILEAGAAGVAFGILQRDGSVDSNRCEQLLRQLAGHEAVFHRAFDAVPDPANSLKELMALGFSRVMTSGQAQTAAEGQQLIGSLVRSAPDHILAAGGIRPHTVTKLIAATGVRHIHCALLRERRDSSIDRLGASFSKERTGGESVYRTTDEDEVRRLVAICRDTP